MNNYEVTVLRFGTFVVYEVMADNFCVKDNGGVFFVMDFINTDYFPHVEAIQRVDFTAP